MANTGYANGPTNVVCTGGGAVGANAGTGTQLSSTSIACRVVRLSTTSADTVHWSVSSTNISLGALVPNSGGDLIGIDDVSKVWLYASTTASVFATYMY